jgi:ketosteroid isomerase-like protein
MNRSAVSVALVFVLTSMVMVLAGCQPAADTNRNANATATASPAKETFNAAAIEAEVAKVGRDWMKAGETYDVEQIKRIVADDAILVYPDGSSGTKADEVRIAESKAITGEGWEVLEAKVTVLDADSAFVTGRSRFKNTFYKEPNMKKAINLTGDYRYLDVYARRNGNWQVIASAATKIAAPVVSPSPAASPAASAPAPPSPSATRTP